MSPKCPCGNPAYTTIVQIPACKECSEKYEKEGHLPMSKRVFFQSFLDMARKANHPKATQYSYHGY